MVMGIGSCSERRGRTGRAVLVRDAFKKCLACVFRLGGDDGQSNRRLTRRSKKKKGKKVTKNRPVAKRGSLCGVAERRREHRRYSSRRRRCDCRRRLAVTAA